MRSVAFEQFAFPRASSVALFTPVFRSRPSSRLLGAFRIGPVRYRAAIDSEGVGDLLHHRTGGTHFEGTTDEAIALHRRGVAKIGSAVHVSSPGSA